MMKLPLSSGLPKISAMSPGGGQAHRGVVRRHGLDRQRARGLGSADGTPARRWYSGGAGFGPALEHQGGQDFQVGVQGLPVERGGQLGRQARLGLLIGEARVGGAQLQVGDQPVELPVAALDHHEPALLHGLGRDGQAHVEVFFQSAAHDITD